MLARRKNDEPAPSQDGIIRGTGWKGKGGRSGELGKAAIILMSPNSGAHFHRMQFSFWHTLLPQEEDAHQISRYDVS